MFAVLAINPAVAFAAYQARPKMNYRACSIEELANPCKAGDLGARMYAGEHFQELLDGYDEWLREGYETEAFYVPPNPEDFEWLPPRSEFWRIG